MTRRLVALVGGILLCAGLAGPLRAATVTLSNGQSLEGEPISFNPQGLVLKLADGTFTPRVAWTNLTQDALKELVKNPKAKVFAEPYVEADEPEEEVARKAALVVKPRIPDRLERPNPKATWGALFSSSLTLSLFIILYLANIYAGFEIAIFRNYPIVLVCVVAAVIPVLGPVVFLCLPPRLQKTQDELAAESMAQHQAEAEAAALAYAEAHPGEEMPEAPAAPVETGPKTVVYSRGQTTFNRRFFETKFAGFLRMVPGEAERDKVIFIKSSRGEYLGSRLSRIQPNEIYLQINKAGATSDVMIPFTEIMEIQVRQKDPATAPSH